jgi:hypothetical protein
MFRLNRKSKMESRSEFVGLPSIPDPIDDNLYLASAVKAAIVDKESGAYDEFLFSENGISEMPFEESLESHLGLVSHRIADQGRRELLIRQQNLLQGQSRLALAEASVERERAELRGIQQQLEKQESILSGEQTGKDNLFWKDAVPEYSSRASSRLRLWTPILVFIFVGLVDIGIIWLSLLSFLGDEREALLFSIPAVGIQLMFPHLIGERISLNRHGSHEKKQNTFEAVALFVMWMIFCSTLTFTRMQFISKELADNDKALTLLLYNVLLVMNFLMLIGLGSILIFQAMKKNPHFLEYHRLKLKQSRAQKRLGKKEMMFTRSVNQIPLLEFSHDVTKESFEEAAGAVNSSLTVASKKVYRRALVNRFGEVDFTSSYLNSKENRAKRGEDK